MVVQRNDDALAGNNVKVAVRLVIEDQPASGAARQPAVYTFQSLFVDILKIAILLEDPWLHACADIVAAVPVIRLNGADLIVLHLVAPVLGIWAIPAAQRTAMDSVEAESVHVSSHPSKGGEGSSDP